jgi:hypothetical protein
MLLSNILNLIYKRSTLLSSGSQPNKGFDLNWILKSNFYTPFTPLLTRTFPFNMYGLSALVYVVSALIIPPTGVEACATAKCTVPTKPTQQP